MLRCQRCGGNLRAEEDYEWRQTYLVCMACGRSPEVVVAEPIPDRPSTRERFSKVCERCGATYLSDRSDSKARRFCSQKCAVVGRGGYRANSKPMTVSLR